MRGEEKRTVHGDRSPSEAPRPSGFRRNLPLLGLIAVGAIFVLHAVHLAALAEDAFIGFRFAKNLAAGHGLVWNLGELPVEGYTNFLWILLSAAAILTGLDVATFAQSLGTVAGLATIGYTYLFARRILSVGRVASLLPCLFLACSGPLAAWANSGMETALFTFLVLSSCYHVATYHLSGSGRMLGLGFVLCLLATLTRPEGFGIFGILLAVHVTMLIRRRDGMDLRRSLPIVAAAYLLPFAVYFFWRYAYFGFPLPNTFYAKVGATTNQVTRGLAYVGFFGLHYLLPLVPLFYLLFRKARGRREDPSRAARSNADPWPIREKPGILICLAVFVCYLLYVIAIGGDYMAMYRFLVPVLPFLYLLLLVLYRSLVTGTNMNLWNGLLASGLLVFGLAGTLVHSTPVERYVALKPPMTHGNYRGIQVERWHSSRLSTIGRFFKEYAEGKLSLATGAIGAVSWYSDLDIYGFHGMVDRVIAHQRTLDIGTGFPGHEKGDLEYILSKEPTFFMFNRVLRPKPLSYPLYEPAVTKALERDYEIVSMWLEDDQNGEAGYFTFLRRRAKGTVR